MNRLFLYALFIFSASSLEALESLSIISVDDKINLSGHLEYFVDEDRQHSIEEMVSGAAAESFNPAESDNLNFGYSGAPHWIRFSLDLRESDGNIILELENAYLMMIDIYYEDERGDIITFSSTGGFRPPENKNIPGRNNVWLLSDFSGTETILYIRIISYSSKGLPLYLWDPADYFPAKEKADRLIYVITGTLMILTIYMLIIGISIRIREYIYLSMVILSYGIMFLLSLGVLNLYWPFNRYISMYLLPQIAASVFPYFFCRFSEAFCPETGITKRIYRYMKTVLLILIFFSIILPLRFKLTLIAFIFIALTTLYCLVAAAAAFTRGRKDSLFYIISFCPTIIFFILRLLKNTGIVPDNSITAYGIVAAFPITLLLFAASLSYRLNLIQRQSAKNREEALANLQKLNGLKDHFLSSTAHELRTPLNGIIGLTETVLNDPEQQYTAVGRENLKAVKISAWRLSRIVNDILDHSKGQLEEIRINRTAVRIRQLADSVIINLATIYAGKPVELINSLSPALPCIAADENRLQQVLFNLLGNALKFTPSGRVDISAEVDGDMLKIIISDTGIGIPEDQLETVFEPYKQCGDFSHEYGGTGLGLSVTRRLIELHGGDIRAESVVNRGSNFIFTVPLATEDAADPCPASETVEDYILSIDSNICELPRNGENLIIAVDDEPLNLRVIQSFLADENYHVHPLQSGHGLQEFLDGPVKAELIILDIFMPEISGYRLCREIRSRYLSHELPVLMLTASGNPDDMAEAFAAGANDYITKPVSREELLARVETHIKLKKSVERIKLSNRKLSEIDRLINFGFLASSFILKNKLTPGQETVILRKAAEYYKPVFDQHIESSGEEPEDGKPGHYFSNAFSRLMKMDPERLQSLFEQIALSAPESGGSGYTEEEIEGISTDVFDLISSLLTRKDKLNRSPAPDWEGLRQQYGLTPKETETATLVYEGYSNQEIADRLGGIAVNTVKQHVYRLFNKVGAENRTHLIYKLIENTNLRVVEYVNR